MRRELKVFRFGPSELGPENTVAFPADWEPIGGEYRDGTLWIVATRALPPEIKPSGGVHGAGA